MIQGRTVAREVEDKENKTRQRYNSKPSRIPRPVSRARGKPLQVQNSVPPSPPPQPRISHTPSRVKPVPDFAKLHKSFREKITKAKENKVLTEFKTFNITPSSVKRKQRRPPEQGSEKDSRAVQVGFKETSLPQPDPLFDEEIGPLLQGPPKALPFSPRTQIRLSVYSKTERALQRLLQKSSAVISSGAAPETGAGEFSMMLQRLVQTTVSSIRTVSRVPETSSEADGLEEVKVRLESQLNCVEEEDEEVTMVAPDSPPHTSHTLTRPHPLPSNAANPQLPVYTREPELCDIVWNKHVSPDNRRPYCPVADLLEQCYLLPVSNVVCRDRLRA